jgi:hypothetical protein
MDERHATEITGGDVAGNITDDTAADSYEEGFAVGVGAGERATERFDAAKVFERFGVIKEVEVGSIFGADTAADGFADGAPDFGRRNDLDAGEFGEREYFRRGVAKEAGAAEDFVRAGGGFHFYAFYFHVRGSFECNTRGGEEEKAMARAESRRRRETGKKKAGINAESAEERRGHGGDGGCAELVPEVGDSVRVRLIKTPA